VLRACLINDIMKSKTFLATNVRSNEKLFYPFLLHSQLSINIDATTPSIEKNFGFKLNARDRNLDYMIKSNFWTNFLSRFYLPLAFFSASSVKLHALFLIWCFMYERLEQIVTTINLPISPPSPTLTPPSKKRAPFE